MASITTEGRNELIALYVAMFNAAPGASALSEMATLIESGKTLIDVANTLTGKANFSTVYPGFLTSSEFADKLASYLLGSEVSAAASDWAKNWVKTQLAAGKGVAYVFATAVQSLRSTAATDFLNAKTALTNKVAVGSYYAVDKGGNATDLTTLQNVIKGVSSTATTVDTAKSSVDGVVAVAIGQTYNLTTSVDAITGTAGNDTINSAIDTTGSTFTALDTIDGGAGTDKLIINDLNAAGSTYPASAVISGVENIILNGAGTVNVDTTSLSITGLTSLTVAAAGNITAKVGNGVALTAAGSVASKTVTATATDSALTVTAKGAVTADGGSSQTITAAGGVTLGGTTVTKGAIVVTDTAQAKGNSNVQGGSTVTLTTTYDANATTDNQIKVGGTTNPTGAVNLTINAAGSKAGNTTGGDVAVTGGTTVTVKTVATSPINTATLPADNIANFTVTQPAVSVTGTTATTSVSVAQSAAATAANSKIAVTATSESASVVFTALAATKTIILDGITLTAPAGGLTAKQVAAAFANLSSGVGTAYTTGAVSGTNSDTVTFTAKTAGNATDLADTGDGAATAITITQGTATQTVAGTGGVVRGAVTVTDANKVTTSLALTHYGNSTFSGDVLSTLSLVGSGGTLGITNNGTAGQTLGLTVDSTGGALGAGSFGVITDVKNAYKTLNVTTAGPGGSTVADIAATGITTLNVSGSKTLTLTAATGMTALTTVNVTGAAGLSATGGFAGTVTKIDASGSTGTNTVTVGATVASYTGGSGTDTVTINATPTQTINGGAGTADILVLNNTAATFSNPSSNTNISNFEILGLGAAANGSYDATGFTGLRVGAVAAAVTFTNVAAGAGLNITASPGFGTTYTLKDATGTADSLAVTIANAVTGNTVTANGIETVTISSGNSAFGTAFNGASSLTVAADAVKSIVLSGSGGTGSMTLTATATTLTSVDATAYAGKLTYTAAGTVSSTVKGGTGVNVLTASTGTVADTLIGGAKDDTITGNKGLSILTGNGGNDVFVLVASANVNSYTTITDANAGDTVRLVDKGVETFAAAKITLADTAVFQDYANAAINAGGDASTNGYVAWFQYGGNTYIVESMHNATATPDFQNGTDAIVKLTGLVDLSTAAFFQSGAAPEVVIK